MNSIISSSVLKRLQSGEFAVLDKTRSWRFFRQSESGFPVEMPGTPNRFELLFGAENVIHVHELPESFKSGFVRAFYGASLPYEHGCPIPGSHQIGILRQIQLDWLLFFIGFEAGQQLKSSTSIDPVGAESSAWLPATDARAVGGPLDRYTETQSA